MRSCSSNAGREVSTTTTIGDQEKHNHPSVSVSGLPCSLSISMHRICRFHLHLETSSTTIIMNDRSWASLDDTDSISPRSGRSRWPARTDAGRVDRLQKHHGPHRYVASLVDRILYRNMVGGMLAVQCGRLIRDASNSSGSANRLHLSTPTMPIQISLKLYLTTRACDL